jgi:hypothetical protein
MQVYLPDDLYEQVNARDLPASELLQKAVRAELRRLDLLTETDRYVADLIAEVGPPGEAQRSRAFALHTSPEPIVVKEPTIESPAGTIDAATRPGMNPRATRAAPGKPASRREFRL